MTAGLASLQVLTLLTENKVKVKLRQSFHGKDVLPKAVHLLWFIRLYQGGERVVV